MIVHKITSLLNLVRTEILVRAVLAGGTLVLTFFPLQAQAQTQELVPVMIEVEVDADFEPTSVVGLVINMAGTIQKPGLDAKPGQLGKLIVAVPVTANEIDPTTSATAILRGPNDALAFGTVRALNSASSLSTLQSYANLPQCASGTALVAKTTNSAALESDKIALLDSLVKIRSKRRETLQAQLALLLTPDLLTRISKLERGFGLAVEPEISATLPPAAIADRLARLLAVLKNYDEKRLREKASS